MKTRRCYNGEENARKKLLIWLARGYLKSLSKQELLEKGEGNAPKGTVCHGMQSEDKGIKKRISSQPVEEAGTQKCHLGQEEELLPR